jgi:putative ABC transport system ATP-binding protein
MLNLQDVHKRYGDGPRSVHALRGVDLTVDAGEFTVICGASGSGKSTLLNLIGGLDAPTSGRIALDDTVLGDLSPKALARLRGQQVGFVFQHFNLVPVLTALENVALALTLARDRDHRADRARRALEEVGLGDFGHRRPSELSGGQQQRVAIARALVKAPRLVLADEPTANLDSATSAEVLDVMRRLHDERGTTFLFSTHDPAVMDRADRLVHMRDGRVA